MSPSRLSAGEEALIEDESAMEDASESEVIEGILSECQDLLRILCQMYGVNLTKPFVTVEFLLFGCQHDDMR